MAFADGMVLSNETAMVITPFTSCQILACRTAGPLGRFWGGREKDGGSFEPARGFGGWGAGSDAYGGRAGV